MSASETNKLPTIDHLRLEAAGVLESSSSTSYSTVTRRRSGKRATKTTAKTPDTPT